MKLLIILNVVILSLVSPLLGQTLKSNMKVHVAVAGVPPEEISRITTTYQIDGEGYLRLPLLDNVRIKASGLTSPKLAVVIGDTYKSKGIYSSPVFTVSSFKDADEERRQIDLRLAALAEKQRKRLKAEAEADERKRKYEAETQVVHVEGDAAKPGQYPLTAGMTLRSLMAAFGGSGQWGSKQRIIHTQGSKTTEYNYKKNPAVLNIRVKAGDFVKIPKGGGLLGNK